MNSMRLPGLLGASVGVWLVAYSGLAHAATYYVDSTAGNDAAAGTSTSTPWKNLSKLNATTFLPGDTILLKAGSHWSSQSLHPLGSGTASQLIKLDMYGTGAKPKIDGNGIGATCTAAPTLPTAHPVSGVVNLIDQDYWEIRNIEVTNTATLGGFICEVVGIKVRNTASHVSANHIYIGNTIVHGVNGYVGGNYAANAGIAITSDMNTSNPCPNWPSACPANPSWDSVTLENNTIYGVDRIAIYVGPDWQDPATPGESYTLFPRRMSNVAIRGNTMYDIGADGILTLAALNVTIENNVLHDSGSRIIGVGAAAGIWTALTINSVIQYNEVYRYALPNAQGAHVVLDGEAFDTDWGTVNQTIQYNYSHDNGGGFLLTCEIDTPSEAAVISNQRVRYNISYNDGAGIGVFRYDCGKGTFPAGPDPSDINNNLIYVSPTQTGSMFYVNTPSITGTAYIYNNIYYVAAGGSVAFPGFSSCASGGQCFGSNVYFGTFSGGSLPSDFVAANVFNPKFVSAAAPGIGRSTTNGLKLKSGSPALGTGYAPGWGIDGQSNLGPLDFWGNAVGSPTVSPNRGPYNGPGL